MTTTMENVMGGKCVIGFFVGRVSVGVVPPFWGMEMGKLVFVEPIGNVLNNFFSLI